MDVSKNCVARRTRYQRQKAEEELLEKAKMLKDGKDKRKRSVKRSSKKSIQKRSSKDSSDDEASCSDVEILGEVYVPLGQRKEGPLPQSRIARLHRSITIGPIDNTVSSPGRDAMDTNQNQERQKDIGAPSRSSSISASKDDDLSYYKRSELMLSSGESDDINYNGDGNQNHGRNVENGDLSMSHSESSAEEDGCKSDDNDCWGGENQNQETQMEIGDPSMSISESSSEEDGGDQSDDKDYKGAGSESFESDSDDSGYYSEDELGGGEDEGDGKTTTVKTSAVDEEMVEFTEDEGRGRKRTVNKEGEDGDSRSTLKEMDPLTKRRKSGDVLEENGIRKRKVLGLDIWVDVTKKGNEVRKSLLERLRPRQVSESTKKKLDSGKPSCPVRVFESDESDLPDDGSSEADDVSNGDYLVPKSRRKSSTGVRKPSNRKTHESNDIDFMNILHDSIWEKGDALKEKLPPLEDKAPNDDLLPLKFRFQDEDPAPLEKDEGQKEVDNLFTDLEMGWTEDEIGFTKLSKEDNDNAIAMGTDPAERCRLGYHFLILDESIGLICKYCRTVQEEMKHLLPDLKTPSRRRQEWIDLHNNELSVSYGFQFGDSISEDHYAFIDVEGSVLDIIPAALRRKMYEHQLDGFEFLWKNIGGATLIEDIQTPLSEGGTGCIISHAPGTGKTYLTIVFLLTFMKVHQTCRPVIIAPLTMLRSWAAELKRWKINIPFHNLNDPDLSGEENVMAASIVQRVGSAKQDRDYKRMVKLYSWTKDRSILGIGYNLFEKLVGEHGKGDHREKFRKILLELPSILILDEGHTPRNQNSLLWKALTKVKTGRRIILSGTPFQNNFEELYNTFCLVNPKFSERILGKTCRHGAKNPAWNSNPAKGRWASLTSLINKNADDAVEELRAMMNPFVHVHKGTILQESLPGLKDTLVVLNPTDLQKKLLPEIPDNVLEKVHLASLVSVHPSLVAQHKAFSAHKSLLEKLEMSPEAGVKTQFVIEIVRLSKACGEKVLIFSEYIDPLNYIMQQLTCYFSWEEGKQVLYMDGKLDEKQRQLVISSLNANDSDAKVLLASTKACCEGISLVGASRVVLLDVVWNPSVERQAISRAYRLGQKKLVYVYHLIMSGTMEVEKYQRQAKKDRISELVFSSRDGHNYKSKFSGVSGDKILEAMVHHKKLRHIFEKILHQPKESNVFENFNLVSSAD